MKIYTKTGDDGTTGLIGGARVSKASPLMETLGTIDELNAALGVARSLGSAFLEAYIADIQSVLFSLGGALASPSPNFDALNSKQLESSIDAMTGELAPLRNFILPGGTPLAAQLHVARTVCRRAERCLIAFDSNQTEPLVYLNRLSDWLFTAARYANFLAGESDIIWNAKT